MTRGMFNLPTDSYLPLQHCRSKVEQLFSMVWLLNMFSRWPSTVHGQPHPSYTAIQPFSIYFWATLAMDCTLLRCFDHWRLTNSGCSCDYRAYGSKCCIYKTSTSLTALFMLFSAMSCRHAIQKSVSTMIIGKCTRFANCFVQGACEWDYILVLGLYYNLAYWLLWTSHCWSI